MKAILSLLVLFAVVGPVQAQNMSTVQSALTLLGYDPGPIDGAWGGKTRSALEAFYETRPTSFDGTVDRNDYAILAGQLSKLVGTGPNPADAPKLDIALNFSPALTITVPAEYAFSDGADSPKIKAHDYTVPFPFVGDVNGDACDDIVSQFMDSHAHPRILYGRAGLESGQDLTLDAATDVPRSRAIRNVSRRDADGDGTPDFVAFTAPHRLEGIGFVPGDEPDIVVVGGKAKATRYATFAHGGLVGDVDGDGITDIFPIQERGGSARYALLGDGSGSFEQRFRVRALPGDTIFSARSADFNGDGLDDFVFLTARDYGREKQVPPALASENGAFAVALGEPGKSINDLKFVRYGQHWMDPVRWTLFRLRGASDAGYDVGNDWSYAAPSNIDLIDFDDDGDLDILIGYFVSANSSWVTSGFQLHRNDGGAFVDVTDTVVPRQPENRNVIAPTEALIGAGMIDLNGDGAKDLLLAIQTEDGRSATGFRSSVFVKNGDRFEPVQSGGDGLGALRYLTVGDVNCDGRDDIVGLGNKTSTQQYLQVMLAKPEPGK